MSSPPVYHCFLFWCPQQDRQHHHHYRKRRRIKPPCESWCVVLTMVGLWGLVVMTAFPLKPGFLIPKPGVGSDGVRRRRPNHRPASPYHEPWRISTEASPAFTTLPRPRWVLYDMAPPSDGKNFFSSPFNSSQFVVNGSVNSTFDTSAVFQHYFLHLHTGHSMISHEDEPLITSSSHNSGDHSSSVSPTISASTAPPLHKKIRSTAPTAPEVMHWTEVMRDGWNEDWSDTTGWTGMLSSSTDTSRNDISSFLFDTDLSDYDRQQIELYWQRLVDRISYLGTERVAKIHRALCVAYRAHRGQVRKSGEPFIVHPVEVAILLSDLKMDAETVMAGLLHDTVEDTELTFPQIESMFGKTVRSIVEGETKVSKLPKLAFSDFADEQAENLRQMFVAMTDDYRIIIVKLADRLHNMRTLQFMKPEKQVKISRETLDIFAPLAHRMGIWQFKSELEDTAFMYLYPQEYKRLSRRLFQHQNKYRETLDWSQETLQRRLNSDTTLQQQAQKVEVFGRTKEIYSLWHKMETKGEHNLDHIVDVVALRVIITPRPAEDQQKENEPDRGVWLCYHVLGLVQHLPGFQPVPTRVKDYISFPKPNGYQSLHTALILNGQTIEIQIRTSRMHQVAEYGMASHWAYTDGKRRGNPEEMYNTPWMSSIKEWQNDRMSSRDFVESVRKELLGKRVFVFLRNGKILNLARGATVVDVAFQIHTEVGLNMHGVEINGKPAPFSYELRNGDVVYILTGEGKPSVDWMRYATSRSTRSKLRAYFRARQKESLLEAGKILLMDYLWMHGPLIERSSYLEGNVVVPATVQELAKFLPGKTRYTDVDELLVAIGKQHDRTALHKIVSQIFGVSKRALAAAEENRRSLIPNSVVAAVHERRQRARESAEAAASGQTSNADEKDVPSQSPPSQRSISLRSPSFSIENVLASLNTGLEYADPEQLCEDCLPIHGDQVVGTRPPHDMSVTTVHRIGCPHAQRAINQAISELRHKSFAESIKQNRFVSKPMVDSVTLRQLSGSSWGRRSSTSRAAKFVDGTYDVPVRLQWSDLDEEPSLYLTEVVIHATDRKLLLADCSEVVSEGVEILRSGSSTNDEHATLVYLIRVSGLDQLQALMDRIGQIRSVMSVERRFGSELLR